MFETIQTFFVKHTPKLLPFFRVCVCVCPQCLAKLNVFFSNKFHDGRQQVVPLNSSIETDTMPDSHVTLSISWGYCIILGHEFPSKMK